MLSCLEQCYSFLQTWLAYYVPSGPFFSGNVGEFRNLQNRIYVMARGAGGSIDAGAGESVIAEGNLFAEGGGLFLLGWSSVVHGGSIVAGWVLCCWEGFTVEEGVFVTGCWRVYWSWLLANLLLLEGTYFCKGGLLLLWRSVVASGCCIVAGVGLMLLGVNHCWRDLLLREGSNIAGCWRVYWFCLLGVYCHWSVHCC